MRMNGTQCGTATWSTPLLLLPPFGKEDQPGDWGPNRLALHHSLLLSLGEEGNLVVDILQHDEDGGFAGKLLSSIVLEIEEKLGVVAKQTPRDFDLRNPPQHVLSDCIP